MDRNGLQATPKTAPAAPATRPEAQPKADNAAPATSPTKVADPEKAANATKGQAKPQASAATDSNVAVAQEKPVPNRIKATTPDAGAATKQAAAKQQPAKPKDQKQTHAPQPATAGSR